MLLWILECIFSTCGLVIIALFGAGYYYLEINRLAEIRWRYGILRKRRQQQVKEAIGLLQKNLRDNLQDEGMTTDITKLTLIEIKKQLDKGELKAKDVLVAFQTRALRLHEMNNCLVEPVREAEEDAAAVDEKKRTGILAGIPVSIKDDIGIEGYVTTAGLAKYLTGKTLEDSVLVQILRKNGAVIFARTNIPQAESSAESSNPIYGTTLNPHHPNRSPGGSSSGEGSLVGGGGSLLGFGSDIGGSIRIPAHNCGCCGFKPTSARVSHLGLPKFMEEPGISPTWGPLARDVDSLVLAMKALWDGIMAELDPLSPPLEFQTQRFEDQKPLKIGFFYDNGLFPPTPVVSRALDMAIKELQRQGHQVVEWIPPDIDKADELEYRAILADGGDNFMSVIEGDIVDNSIKPIIDMFRVPRFLRPLIPFLARKFKSERHGIAAEALLGTGTVFKYWQLQGKLKEYQNKITAEWQKEGLDALICPPQPYPALPLGHPGVIGGAVNMFLFNVLDYPAGIVRMTKQKPEDIKALKSYEIKDKAKLEKFKKMVSEEGLPVGVMVASLRWQDEKCLRVMKCVEEAADFVIQ